LWLRGVVNALRSTVALVYTGSNYYLDGWLSSDR